MTDPAGDVRTLAAPLAAQAGVELLDVQVKGAGPGRLVRVVVDRRGGVPIDVIQSLAGEVSAVLDDHDPLEGRYSLEVTSPGIDWPLTEQRDFKRVAGRDVLVQHDAGEGRVLQTRGVVRTAEDDAVVLDVEGDEQRIPYELIRKASQTLPW